jgi:haloacetate dehalogenase
MTSTLKPASRLIALCLDQSWTYAREVLKGFSDEASTYPEWDVRTFASTAELLARARQRKLSVSAVAGIFENAREVTQVRTRLKVPTVSLAASVPDTLLPTVTPDNARAARLAAEHLLAQGLTHFSYCGVADLPYSEERQRGFSRRMAEAGHGVDHFLFESRTAAEHPSPAEVKRLSDWLVRHARPLGLLVGAPFVLRLLLRVLHDVHLQVPQDVAIVRVGDEASEHLASPITQSHVVLPTHEVGVRAARLVQQLLAGGTAPPTPVKLAPVRLQEAQSSNLLAVSDRQIERALRFIRTHQAEAVTVDQVAAHAGLARRTLERRFRAVLKRSPKEELDRARLGRIRELLATSEDKLDAIARTVGLQDGRHLNAFFTQREGLTPGEFRRIARRETSSATQPGKTATALITGFAFERVRVGEVRIACEVGGSGPPLLLLHGFPQDRLMWRLIAPQLARTHTVICADLRGYGDSDAPPGDARHETYCRRTMAKDQVDLMRSLGYDRFSVVGHDRGGRVGHRMALDFPREVERLAVLDIVPTATIFETVGRQLSHGYYHWFFLSQPFDLPERLIAADPGYYVQSCLQRWSAAGMTPFSGGAFEHYRARWQAPERIHASCEDYRAAATIDLEHDHDHARRRIACPLLTLWGAEGLNNRLYDVLQSWKDKASGPVSGRALPCGHFLPEESPEATYLELAAFLAGKQPAR